MANNLKNGQNSAYKNTKQNLPKRRKIEKKFRKTNIKIEENLCIYVKKKTEN